MLQANCEKVYIEVATVASFVAIFNITHSLDRYDLVTYLSTDNNNITDIRHDMFASKNERFFNFSSHTLNYKNPQFN